MMGHEHPKHSDSHGKHPQGGKYDVSLQSDPAAPSSREPARLTIIVTERETGDRIGRFEVIHDKLTHLVVVSDDLSYFAHIHPRLDDKERIFTIAHAFPTAGRYKMWVDAKPQGGGQFVKDFRLDVKCEGIQAPVPIVADKNFSKEIVAGSKKYQVRLKVPESIKSGQDAEIVFELSDSQGRPITDLEPLMAAGGHCVIITSDAEKFLHVHPLEGVIADWRGGPEVAFRANFPSPGLYKAWGQFKHRGDVITADFVLKAE
ncbi:MAG: hypothetical protein ACREAY_03040 [Nitrososphaera sp.]|uniref:hypothetical protein n=1 Tax=Nitrososphaera sp. TaxID=1971748 RepID=UPI003D6FE648